MRERTQWLWREAFGYAFQSRNGYRTECSMLYRAIVGYGYGLAVAMAMYYSHGLAIAMAWLWLWPGCGLAVAMAHV